MKKVWWLFSALAMLIFSIVPQCGAFEMACIMIFTFILICFEINIKARIKRIRGEGFKTNNKKVNDFIEKTAPRSARIFIFISMAVAVIFYFLSIFVATVCTIANRVHVSKGYFTSMAIIRILKAEQWNTLGFTACLLGLLVYLVACSLFVFKCKSYLKLLKED